jgi:pseudaminic acid synthase
MSSILNISAKQNLSVLVVAEVSANHNQSFDTAVVLINRAKECGADAVKFQAYTPDTLTIDCDNEYFRIDHPEWGGQTLYELYRKAYTPWEWLGKLKKIADELEIIFLCTAFDKTSVDLLEGLNICVHKISSFELVDLPLIEYAAKTGKPLIMSTGMADLSEIAEAVDTARKAGAEEITLLKCVSSYPANPEDMNLRTKPDMKERFSCPVGFSDHSLGIGASVCAVALGAAIVEKHFTLSRKTKTPDSFFSIEPQELKQLVENIRTAEKALGKVHYGLTEDERKSRTFRRSLFVVEDVKKGEVFSQKNVRTIRPSDGLAPNCISTILGRKAMIDINRGTPLSWDLVEIAPTKQRESKGACG